MAAGLVAPGGGSSAAPGRSGATPSYHPPGVGGTFAGAVRPVNETLMEQSVKLLSGQLGPIARVVVKRAAERTRQRDAFFALLLEAAPEATRARLSEELHKLP